MKTTSATKPANRRVLLIPCFLAAMGMALPVAAGLTELSDTPLPNVSGSSVTVLPNVYFLFDNSGSMKRDFMPDGRANPDVVGLAATQTTNSRNFYNSYCNTIWYNPNFTYPMPAKANGTLYTDSLWNSASKNGYSSSASTVNLGTAPGTGSWGVTGSDLDTNRYLCTYTGGGTPTEGSCYSDANYSCTTQAQAQASWTAAQKKNFANWYSFYRTRLMMAKAAIGLAVKDIRGVPKTYAQDPTDADYLHANIGLNNIYDTSPLLDVAPFEGGTGSQKDSFYSTLYGLSGSSGTPTRTALESAGEMYSDEEGPIKYACQRNYTVLMTDGYWNGDDPSVGNQDGGADRPQWDGASSTTTVTSTLTRTETFTWTTYAEARGGCSSTRRQLATTQHSQPYVTRTITTTITVNGVTGTPSTTTTGPTAGADTRTTTYSGSCVRPGNVTLPPDTSPVSTGVLTTGPVETTTTEDTGGSTNTMADVAMKYYSTNLRPDLTPNDESGNPVYKLPEPKSSANLKLDDVARWPHMTTFTVGLGVDGVCSYDANYKDASHLLTTYTSDFSKIYNNTGTNDQASCNGMWPVPAENTDFAIDDLWHAAVNGRGTYFSTKNPKVLAASLRKIMADVSSAEGSGAAGGSTSVVVTSGTDYNFSGSYTTGDWTGDLAAYAVTSTGASATTATWSAATQLKGRAYTDRAIYTSKIDDKTRINFQSSNYTTPEEQGWFANSQLNQYNDEWTEAQKTAGTQEKLINFLRGDATYETKADVATPLYRARTGPLGDIVHSQPVYVGAPAFNFTDTGYASFKASNKSRAGTVYVGANDGMLHAFNSTSGAERWAYVPPMVVPNMWRLADRDYASHHHYYVDGPIAIYDAAIGTNGAWRTVLISALGAGGRGYFALDITDATSAPTVLWTFSAEDDPDVGYTTGTPIVAKVNGEWVAVLASGYNNVPEGEGASQKYADASGKGYVFVRKLSDGSSVKKIATGAGSTASPSGLATLNVHIKSSGDFTAQAAYGGDLTGRMYRFDLDKGTVSTLIDLGDSQPITSFPEIATLGGYPMVYFGTGKYLGKPDLGNTDQQYIYAVKDKTDSSGSTHKVVVSELAQATLDSTGKVTAPSTTKEYGWYVALPHSGERVHIHPQLQAGVVLFATAIPGNNDDPCNVSGGSGWIYQFNYQNGGSPDSGNNQIGTKLTYMPVGISIIAVPSADGKSITPMFKYADASGRSGTGLVLIPKGSSSTDKATRVQWRELLK